MTTIWNLYIKHAVDNILAYKFDIDQDKIETIFKRITFINILPLVIIHSRKKSGKPLTWTQPNNEMRIRLGNCTLLLNFHPLNIVAHSSFISIMYYYDGENCTNTDNRYWWFFTIVITEVKFDATQFSGKFMGEALGRNFAC